MNRSLAVNFTDINEQQLKKIIAAASGFNVLTGDQAKSGLGECEIIFGHVNGDQLREAKHLKWFHAQSAGVENYLRPEMGLSESIILTNSAGMHGIGIAEHLLTFTLMLMRRMHCYVHQQPLHKWEYLGPIQSIYQSRITVVGLGGIGSQYAARCRALGATVLGVVRAPRETVPDCVDELFTIDQLDEAIKDADVVALTLPSTAETIKLFDKARMLKMKKGAFILNIGRGSAIDQDAMIALLESGHLGGAGVDVTDPEPLPTDSKLWDLPNVILTPHVSGGGSLALTSDLIVDRFVEYLQDYIAGRPFKQVVDRKAGY
ncbi:MAG: D-2-hydroxyacid dehydrogenase [Defluviitaleaceae bacterium]|nr:D-2-hydroxyacid dehydrogenase [Defluviitaleaceae bacterium]